MHCAADEHLALTDAQLLSVEKPERYIGHEVHAVYKDAGAVDVRYCICFPDVYDIGMSNLAIQIIYGMLNERDDVWCERACAPWTDLECLMRKEQIPLFALESQDPLREFDILGFTLQYELCYTNVLQMLDLARIPLYAKDRTDCDPLIMGGGPCTYNPEPVADFFDFFYIGEAETGFHEMIDLYKEAKRDGLSRRDFLRRVARMPGIYVPSLYDVTYHEDGTVRAVTPAEEGIPAVIEKELVRNLSDCYYPLKPVVPFIRVAQDRVTLEILRGCIRGCRFCQAGQLYKPFRERDIEVLIRWGIAMLENTGHEEITLSSLSSSDYSSLAELVECLIPYCNEHHVNISLPSLRIDAFSLDVMRRIQDIKKSSLTFAPEAGSQRLRNVINKGLSEDDILRGAREAFLGGWNKVKLYFMLGIPTETEEDLAGIGDIAGKICTEYFDHVPKEERGGRSVEVTASSSFFVPKPFTPFQWAAMDTREMYQEKVRIVKRSIASQVNQKRIRYTYHMSDASVLEGVFARGDRRLSSAVLSAYRKGAVYDAWTEHFDMSKWLSAFEECGIDPAFYAHRERPKEEVFPWDHIRCGVGKEYLYREWERAKRGLESVNCHDGCVQCGAAFYQTGCCVR
ncbi:MAG: TIGR03960 family B12-binding radical SAM protein [Lachnospiraceae bacterium]|nr:TIGR03960 family B12-binding radical SAM protein [Lachnospiraceae bacterium]